MKFYNSIYPIRQFQIDKKLREKLDRLKKSYPSLLHKDNSKEASLNVMSLPMNIPLDYVRNVKDLQGLMYKMVQSQSENIGFLKFWETSRQIFNFDSSLTSMLSLTDIYDIPWESIKLPYRNFYISFGEFGQESFYSNSPIQDYELVIDGAYINTFNGKSLIFPEESILIDFTTRLIAPNYEDAILNQPKGIIFSEPIYPFILSGKQGQTVKDAIQFGEDNFLKYCEHMDKSNFESSTNFAIQNGISIYGADQLHLHVEKYLRGKKHILNVLPLLFNCIFYLTQYPESITEDFQKDTPKKLLDKLNTAKNNWSKKNAYRKIKENGYSRIKFVTSVVKSEKDINITGKELSQHWRRGHWRNQPFGQGLNSHKYIWINPTIVNKDKGDLDSGHIYEVNN